MSRLLRLFYTDGIPDMRWPGFRFHVPPNVSAPETTAAIFFGFYESGEIRLVEANLDGTRDVVELGASLGVVSSHISRKLQPGKKLICVEANPSLIENINKNLARHANDGVDYHVVNKAIALGCQSVQFEFFGNHTESRLASPESSKVQQVPACSLSSIVREHGLKEFTLVCDIEGAEMDLLLNDRDSLKDCQAILIEMHETARNGTIYSVKDIKRILTESFRFRLTVDEGPVGFFQR